MNQLLDINRKYNSRHNNRVKKFCEPLYNHFGVNHFFYYKVRNDGHYTCLGSHAAWMEYYFSEQLYLPNPYLRSPDNFRTGISFIRKVDDTEFQESVNIGIEKFELNQSLLFLDKTTDGVYGYGFATSMHLNHFEALCINELPLLKLFVKRFKEEFNQLILQMEEDCVNIATLIGPSFYKRESPIIIPQIDKNHFLKQVGIEQLAPLSRRENEVLQLIGNGFSASYIADELQLSRRTIEHYTESIKNKLCCNSKTKLIQLAHEFSL